MPWSIIVRDNEGFQVLFIPLKGDVFPTPEDDIVIDDAQTVFPAPYVVTAAQFPVAGTLASPTLMRTANLAFMKFRLRRRRVALKQALQNATDIASLRPAIKNLFEMIEELFELMQ